MSLVRAVAGRGGFFWMVYVGVCNSCLICLSVATFFLRRCCLTLCLNLLRSQSTLIQIVSERQCHNFSRRASSLASSLPLRACVVVIVEIFPHRAMECPKNANTPTQQPLHSQPLTLQNIKSSPFTPHSIQHSPKKKKKNKPSRFFLLK